MRLVMLSCAVVLAGLFGKSVMARADTFSISFEEGHGHDGAAVGAVYNGITFTNSGGLEWLFADSATNLYNTHSVDLGFGWNEDEYNHYGLVAAWLGVSGDWGRIDFVNRDGTYFQLRYCAAFPVVLEAFDSEDNLLSATTGAANLRHANGAIDMGTMRVDAPPGSHIAWVRVHDTGNFWCIDNVEGDFSGIEIVPWPQQGGVAGRSWPFNPKRQEVAPCAAPSSAPTVLASRGSPQREGTRQGPILEVRWRTDRGLCVRFRTLEPNSRLDVVDIAGRHVRTCFRGASNGIRTLAWDGRTDRGEESASGVYLFVLREGDTQYARKALLAK